MREVQTKSRRLHEFKQDHGNCFAKFVTLVYIYHMIERVQTGVRIEKRILKVLKALAEHQDMTLGDLLEGMVLHAFEGKSPFSAETLKVIETLKSVYGLELRAKDSHRLDER